MELTFSYTYLKEFNPCTYIFFGYDVRNRCGDGIRFEYNLNGTMAVSWVKVDRMNITQIGKKIEFRDFFINENEKINAYLGIKENTPMGNIGGHEFSFDIVPSQGHIALERKNFVGEWIIKEISFSTDEEMLHETVIPVKKVKIPLRDGGDIPYEFTYKVEKIGSQYYLTAELDGGTATRELNRKDRPGQYMAELDRIISPFVILRNGKSKKRI